MGFFFAFFLRLMIAEQSFNFSDMGPPGLVIGALFAFIYFLVKEHRAERQEWLIAYREQSKIIDERQVETNAVIRELSAVVRSAYELRGNGR
jgi:hypothetical protein